LELVEAERDAVDFLMEKLSVLPNEIKVGTVEVIASQIFVRGTVREFAAESSLSFEIVYDKNEGKMTRYSIH
jgi:hypothetical protein